MQKTIIILFFKRNSECEIIERREESIEIDMNRNIKAQILEYGWNNLPYGWII